MVLDLEHGQLVVEWLVVHSAAVVEVDLVVDNQPLQEDCGRLGYI